MSDIVAWIYQYVTEHLTLDDPEYRENRDRAAGHYEKLQAALTPEQKEHLLAWQDMSAVASSIESETLFRSSLSIGLELSRLG